MLIAGSLCSLPAPRRRQRHQSYRQPGRGGFRGSWRYAVVGGWVPTPNNAAIPTDVGKAFVAGDAAKGK
jgi:hypothetical protein